ncbi:hypothetical protein KL904_004387 [Ogataea polymorpha]|nr:hypothetical protein KL908_001008 [Ogataea polymorpha]KAG7932596.1 hypothetical protein KL904_004387 [Ogataea polymorpha]
MHISLRSMQTAEKMKNKMDELGVEPKTFRMLSERATNYATRPRIHRFRSLLLIRDRLLWKQVQSKKSSKFRYRESNPGLPGESGP